MISITLGRDSVKPGLEVKLEEAEFFSSLSQDQLARILPRVFEKPFARRCILLFEGEPAAYLWAIREGQVRLFKSSPNGRITALETLGPGEIFGAVSALEREDYPVSAEGMSEGVAWCLPRKLFLALLAQDPRLGVDLLRVVSRRLRSAHERVRSFANDSAPRRLAQALLRATIDGKVRVTRRDLAEAAGTTVETAIRVLRNLERANIIRGEVRCVSVLDEPALRRVAHDQVARGRATD
jgi:CRP/FNR family transcriptional regulator